MKKLIFVFFSLVLGFGMFFSGPKRVQAGPIRGATCSVVISQERDGKTCYAPGCISTWKQFFIRVENLTIEGEPYNGKVSVWIGIAREKTGAVVNGIGEKISMPGTNYFGSGDWKVKVQLGGRGGDRILACNTILTLSSDSECGEANSCEENPTAINTGFQQVPFELCDQINDPDQKDKCLACFNSGSNTAPPGIWTAVGCIPTKAESIVRTFIKIGLSIGGGVTLLLILVGSFQLSISQGDPKKTGDAKDQITSAIIGLIFVILSVTILQFIGVNLFQIPGFGG